ncbi:hypothetical protein XELAEV_18033372mg [Xenopus laevis]|uniref:Helix-turn-helix domain-containing protein n=1 Tax=Xenopus laevis TaxID=8355 RepID=A0A974CK92_XENLA|nr:hypothetical protein XELAEV_18033372mg [Xenopus laevis]
MFRRFGAYYRHYIDDLFFIWYGTPEDLLQFTNDLNSTLSPVRLTLNFDQTSIHYLDVTVYKDVMNNKLQTRIYRKLTDMNTLLHYKSSHPRHLLHSLPRSQLLRVARITSDTEERQKTCSI